MKRARGDERDADRPRQAQGFAAGQRSRTVEEIMESGPTTLRPVEPLAPPSLDA